MARGLAKRPLACVEHPHRPAADHCDECRHTFCPECLVRGGPQLLCRECWVAGPARAAEATRQRNPVYRLQRAGREHRASLVAGGLITGILALLAVSSAAGVLGQSSREHMAEPVARAVLARQLLSGEARPGATPGVPTPNPGPTPVPRLLGQVEPLAGAPGTDLFALIDGNAGGDAPAWHSARSRVAVDLRLTTAGGAALVGRALFAHSAAAPPETWAKDVEVWASPAPDDEGLTYVGRWALAQTTKPQVFAFARREVRTVRLRVLSNHGSAEYTSLAEFGLLPAALGGA